MSGCTPAHRWYPRPMDAVSAQVEYVLPLKWSAEQSERELPELAAYLRGLVPLADVTVIDGSDRGLVTGHAESFGPLCAC
jgi:hypothetical protein